MKRKLISFALACASILPLSAQSLEKISPNLDDIATVLKSSGIIIDKFDISQFNGTKCVFEIYFDEYVDGQKQEIDFPFNFQIRLDSGKQFTDILSSIVVQNDSTALATIDIRNAGAMSRTLKLKKVTERFDYCYRDLDFRLEAIAPKEDVVYIPLKLYASFWVDGEFLRCCDAEFLSPNLTNDVFTLSPHYFIIGLKVWRE